MCWSDCIMIWKFVRKKIGNIVFVLFCTNAIRTHLFLGWMWVWFYFFFLFRISLLFSIFTLFSLYLVLLSRSRVSFRLCNARSFITYTGRKTVDLVMDKGVHYMQKTRGLVFVALTIDSAGQWREFYDLWKTPLVAILSEAEADPT